MSAAQQRGDSEKRARRHVFAKLGPVGRLEFRVEREVSRVLNAAALTYVAATLTGILTLLYYLYRLGLFGRRD